MSHAYAFAGGARPAHQVVTVTKAWSEISVVLFLAVAAMAAFMMFNRSGPSTSGSPVKAPRSEEARKQKVPPVTPPPTPPVQDALRPRRPREPEPEDEDEDEEDEPPRRPRKPEPERSPKPQPERKPEPDPDDSDEYDSDLESDDDEEEDLRPMSFPDPLPGPQNTDQQQRAADETSIRTTLPDFYVVPEDGPKIKVTNAAPKGTRVEFDLSNRGGRGKGSGLNNFGAKTRNGPFVPAKPGGRAGFDSQRLCSLVNGHG